MINVAYSFFYAIVTFLLFVLFSIIVMNGNIHAAWCVLWTERQEQQSLEIERYKRDWQHERDESDQLRQQLQQLQVSCCLLHVVY